MSAPCWLRCPLSEAWRPHEAHGLRGLEVPSKASPWEQLGSVLWAEFRAQPWSFVTEQVLELELEF